MKPGAVLRVGALLFALLTLVALAWAETATAQTTTVDFDAPAPPGASSDLLNGVFQGIDFGTGQWRWESAYNVDPTNHIFFDSTVGTSRTFQFSPAPRTLTSLKVFTTGAGTLTVSDNLGQSLTQFVETGSMQLVSTGWAQASTVVTVAFTSGQNLGVDDITYTGGTYSGPPPYQGNHSDLADSQEPGSVLVFPKFRAGADNVVGQGVVPLTEFEISVKCPKNFVCDSETLPDFPNVFLKAHWVCAGQQGPSRPGICHETDFNLQTTVNGTLVLTSEELADPVTGLPLTGVNQANGRFTRIPRPPCNDFPEANENDSGFTSHANEAYLIVWVIDASGRQIKFDGLTGDALLRNIRNATGPSGTLATYNAIPIQAGESIRTAARTDDPANGGNGNTFLDFNGTEYKMVTGALIGSVRYPGDTFANPAAKLTGTSTGQIITKLSLLTLDVLSNRVNDVTFVDFTFYNEAEVPHSTGTNFVCYITRDITRNDIVVGQGGRNPLDTFLTNTNMSRKGLVVSGPAEQRPTPATRVPVSLLGLFEIIEKERANPVVNRASAYPLFNDSTPVPTTFEPHAPLP